MLALFDLAGIYFRAFHAAPTSITSPDGRPVNAVRGTLDILARVIEAGRPTRAVACLDLDWRPAFRVELLPTYKTHRVAEAAPTADSVDTELVPDELSPQVPVLLEVLAAIGIATAGADGFEADDVIATLADRERADAVEVVTGDRDLFQLARADAPTDPDPTAPEVGTEAPNQAVPAISIRYIGAGMRRMEVLDADGVAQRYGIPAGLYADFAALRGDPSDGLPGVGGIGDKTAATLVSRFGTVEDLVSAAADPASALPAGPRAKLLAADDYLAVAPRVVRVVRDAPVRFLSGGADGPRDDGLPVEPVDPARLIELIGEFGIGSSVKRLLDVLG